MPLTLNTPHGAVEYVTAADIAERWGDVSAARLRAWAAPGPRRGPLVQPLTVGRLAELTGLPLAGRDPGEPARLPGQRGPAVNLYAWPDVLEADRIAREHPSAARRKLLG